MDRDEELQQALREASADIQRAGEIIAEALRPVMDAIIDACKKLLDAVRAEYVARGAIYGDSREGLMRWLEEMAIIMRLQQEIAYRVQRYEMLAEIRAMRL